MSVVMRIGAVNYLNSRPLVYGLSDLAPDVKLCFDLPSRLADSLAAGRLDVALIPSVEWLRHSEYTIVSDACVACRGPVLSVKLYFRVPPGQVRTLALDEGSRTSAALAQILLEKLVGATPDCEPLPIGSGLDRTSADAVLLIGDRAMRPVATESLEVWDLGEKWTAWTDLPFVFAMWVASPGYDDADVVPLLSAARDNGLEHLANIASAEAPKLGISSDLAVRYLRDNLHFTLGDAELRGLRRYSELCVERGLAQPDAVHFLDTLSIYGCTNQ
jgi:chorismate dehydratase